MREIAEEYLLAGLSVIPVNSDKRATIKWERYQKALPDFEDCDELFLQAWGLALISGSVSGGLEVMDFDSHENDIDAIYNRFISDEGVKCILARYNPPIERSPRGGYHILYRYETGIYEGNRKLANWPSGESMIETRGEGGYTVVYPSPNYTMLSGSINSIPSISVDERNYLITLARSLTHDHPHALPNVLPHELPHALHFDNTDPVSYFNWNCSAYAKKLLEEKGWVKLRTDET